MGIVGGNVHSPSVLYVERNLEGRRNTVPQPHSTIHFEIESETHMISKHLVRIALGCALAAAMNVAFAQSVTNGSFESIAGSFNSDGGMIVNSGSTAIAGWSVVGGVPNVAVINNTNVFDVGTPFGVNEIDLTGYSDTFPGAKLQQTVTGFTIGSTYQLSFWLGLNGRGCGIIGNICGGPNGAIVRIDTTTQDPALNITQTFTHSSIGPAIPGRMTLQGAGADRIWDPFTLDFTAKAESLLLSFEAQTAGSLNVHSGLDNVAITTVVPLPAAAWLLLSGLGLLGALQRRRS
jgi:hypothetical protein